MAARLKLVLPVAVVPGRGLRRDKQRFAKSQFARGSSVRLFDAPSSDDVLRQSTCPSYPCKVDFAAVSPEGQWPERTTVFDTGERVNPWAT